MSFIRPEARAALWRWRDVIAGALVLALGLYWGLGTGGILRWIGYAFAGFGVVMVFTGLQRGMFLQRLGRRSAGVIELDERQLTYFGVGGGVIVPLGAVARIEIETNDKRDPGDDVFWRFTLGDDTVMRIPASALGSEKLFDSLSAFPGADYDKVIAASGATDKARFLIWQKKALPEARRLH